MITLHNGPVWLTARSTLAFSPPPAEGSSMARRILAAHNRSGKEGLLELRFDALASHDITYVGIVQTARASGLTRFELPYVLTNCHNSLCAVGGTINEDDHMFGLSAAKKYGGVYVPAHQAVIHQYMRERMAACGSMILGSDSHTRYGALGTLAVGEGGPELVKQLLGRTYQLPSPEVVCVLLTGAPRRGVGPQDVALALIAAVFQSGFVKNKILEFTGPGVAGLSMDFRCGLDVMTTETTCLSSIWVTDQKTEEYLALHGRPEAYRALSPEENARYDGAIELDLSAVEPMIALPFHPSNAYPIRSFLADAPDILEQCQRAGRELLGSGAFTLTDKLRDGRFLVEQGVIAGCAGGSFENICAAADILAGGSVGAGEFALSVYPASQPILMELMRNGAMERLAAAGATLRTAFCGPCFGAGDVPANNGLSIRHSTRNFPNREGAKPGGGQIASVALMDARSIAATAANQGRLTPADQWEGRFRQYAYRYDPSAYQARVYDGLGRPDSSASLRFGPNIADWPPMPPLPAHLALAVAAFITDSVTTTDELIPSGETSSYRSNPHKLAEFTLSRKAPAYVERAKAARALEEQLRQKGRWPDDGGLCRALEQAGAEHPRDWGIGSLVYARRPGDGSAREQAASCQKVLGGWANIAGEYATKRYRSNLINWGMLPLLLEGEVPFGEGDWILLPDIRRAVAGGAVSIPARAAGPGGLRELTLTLGPLSEEEREILLAGCLINHYRGQRGGAGL